MGRLKKRQLRTVAVVLGILPTVFLLLYVSQRFWAHRSEPFVPDYEQVTLTEKSDYETIFLQTGLGRSAAEKVLEQEGLEGLKEIQKLFFHPPAEVCSPLFGWFTREDRMENSGAPLVDLQTGDVLVTLSTHSVGWRHGHAGLVIDKDTVLECGMIGTDSALKGSKSWSSYTNYAVLRIEGVSREQQETMREYALSTLRGVPYRLLAGFIGPKAPESGSSGFGLQCAYLVWYAWNFFGYDLDGDGGRLVSASDLLDADCVEIVQVYGMNPEEMLKN